MIPLQLEVKGRLALNKLDHFLTELRHSRSRTGECALGQCAKIWGLCVGWQELRKLSRACIPACSGVLCQHKQCLVARAFSC